jgi:large subunit ribosomal protein L15
VFVPLNLDRLQAAVDGGRLDPGRPVDLEVLRTAGLVSKRRDGVRLLARGELTTPLTIAVDSASRAAAEAVAKAGGKLLLPGAEAEAPAPKQRATERRTSKAPATEPPAAEPPASE